MENSCRGDRVGDDKMVGTSILFCGKSAAVYGGQIEARISDGEHGTDMVHAKFADDNTLVVSSDQSMVRRGSKRSRKNDTGSFGMLLESYRENQK